MWCDQAKWVWTPKKWKSSFRVQKMYALYSVLYFVEIPVKIGLLVPEIIAILVLLKTKKYKGNWIYCYLLYLKINISEFRLILLEWSHHIWTWWFSIHITDLQSRRQTADQRRPERMPPDPRWLCVETHHQILHRVGEPVRRLLPGFEGHSAVRFTPRWEKGQTAGGTQI